MAALMLLYSVVRLILFELYQIFRECKTCVASHTKVWHKKIKNFSYIWDYSNWLEIPLFCLSIIYAIIIFMANSKSFCLSQLEWQVGSVVICLLWIELILISRQFKFVGVQAKTFWRVLTTFFEFVPFAMFLLAAFGISFYLLLYQSNYVSV